MRRHRHGPFTPCTFHQHHAARRRPQPSQWRAHDTTPHIAANPGLADPGPEPEPSTSASPPALTPRAPRAKCRPARRCTSTASPALSRDGCPQHSACADPVPIRVHVLHRRSACGLRRAAKQRAGRADPDLHASGSSPAETAMCAQACTSGASASGGRTAARGALVLTALQHLLSDRARHLRCLDRWPVQIRGDKGRCPGAVASSAACRACLAQANSGVRCVTAAARDSRPGAQRPALGYARRHRPWLRGRSPPGADVPDALRVSR
jgi:hypothetical protein